MLRILAITALFAATAQAEDSFSAKIVEVKAPDFFEVESASGKREVRLYGADAPEKGQAHYDDALAYVQERVKGIEVTVEPVATDSLGKTVAKILLPGYVNLNSAIIGEGHAWWDEPNTPQDGVLKKMNAEALTGQKGLFADTSALAPWDYRKSHDIENYTYSIEPEAPKMAKAEKKEETKELKASGKGQYEASAYNYDVSKMNIDESKFSDYGTLITKHQPRVATDASGKVIGLTATDIEQIPYATAFGLKNGDVIAGVNGAPITGIGDVMGLVQANRDAKNLNVNILRDGKAININVAIP